MSKFSSPFEDVTAILFSVVILVAFHFVIQFSEKVESTNKLFFVVSILDSFFNEISSKYSSKVALAGVIIENVTAFLPAGTVNFSLISIQPSVALL